ncbi:MAG: 3-isopropylmalate dehydratase large subunit [Rhodospirillaceae bacterium]|jgi:3-isopropylmalate/(R)-2-methylmalate dehydratase large subunit|nr:3-isopropylmalate dehydratase large subunit [Rhodospirillaceae bacterium]MBT5566118.1 3-isopropylmalate dehydratase large subunit [Rhodospirillaceae bacterium]MBT6090625.1 3-isopropylmalate dehydratase large subunit [Rhodospirillaceae bacterium]
MGRTLIQKLWDAHTVADLGDDATLLYMDRVFLHERTGSVSLKGLEAAGRKVRNPEQVFCTMDHIVDTLPGRGDETIMPSGKDFITTTRDAANAAGITLFDIGDDRQGIVHVVSAEQGITLPGLTQVCPDSHTCTLGALGALAWGIGSTEGEHALATKTLAVNKPKSMRVSFDGTLGFGVTAKDMILHLIGEYTASGGVGHAIEFAGSAIRALPQENRFTVCNMAVEFAAFTGLIPPDDTTIEYVHGRPYAPTGKTWDTAVEYWKTLQADDDAAYDKNISIDCADIVPKVTWGTSPGHTGQIDGVVPDPSEAPDANARSSWERALEYMDLKPGQPIEGVPIDAAFIGSCTNSRLSDLREVVKVVDGHRVADGVKAIVVPGSSQVKLAAEAEGIDKALIEAGFEWRESGCSMCFYAGGESFGDQERVISSTNRNFENRQGPRTRTHLASPTSVAASAIAGKIADVRKLR